MSTTTMARPLGRGVGSGLVASRLVTTSPIRAAHGSAHVRGWFHPGSSWGCVHVDPTGVARRMTWESPRSSASLRRVGSPRKEVRASRRFQASVDASAGQPESYDKRGGSRKVRGTASRRSPRARGDGGIASRSKISLESCQALRLAMTVRSRLGRDNRDRLHVHRARRG